MKIRIFFLNVFCMQNGKKAHAFKDKLCPTIMWSVCNYNPLLRKRKVALVV